MDQLFNYGTEVIILANSFVGFFFFLTYMGIWKVLPQAHPNYCGLGQAILSVASLVLVSREYSLLFSAVRLSCELV